MKNLIKLEEFAIFLLAVYLFGQLDYDWWWYAILFLVPDISMVGYLVGPHFGANTYNLIHHKGVAILLYLLGMLLIMPLLQLAGLVMLGHSSFDRVFGYGLKYSDSFQHTHLGMIGKSEKSDT